MFGYLNLNDPTKIGNNESQECKSLQLDRGYLELMAEFEIDETINRLGKDINGFEIFIDSSPTPANNAVQNIPSLGYLKRRISSVRVDTIGCPQVEDLPDYVANVSPALTATAHGSQPYPAGVYSYIITIYNPETNEESSTVTYTRTVGTNEVVVFTDFPALSANPLFLEKTQAEYRIYRRPLGGAEFLRILSGTTIQAYTANTGPYSDTTADADLGEPCSSIDTFAPDYYNNLRKFSLFTVHNGRLWFKQDAKFAGSPGPDNASSVIWYSERNVFGQVSNLSFFAFNSEVVGLHSIDETLVVLCKENIHVIYGDDETDFVVKQIADGKIGCVGGFSSAVLNNSVFFVSSNKDNRDLADGVFALTGGQLKRISHNVDSLFPFAPYGTLAAPIVYGAGAIRNRFFVVRGKVEGADDNGLLVFDSAANGFLISEDPNPSPPTEFGYRSKDFGSPGKWDDMRRAFVRGVGDFKVELYYDGIKEDEIEFSFSGAVPQTEDFAVPPFRSNYFSFRIIGQADAKVFEFGRQE